MFGKAHWRAPWSKIDLRLLPILYMKVILQWKGVWVKQPAHSFLGDKSLGIQQGTSIWVVSPKSMEGHTIFLGSFYHALVQNM